MLNFEGANTTQNFVVTLTERVSINNPYFLFVFEHVTTKQVFKFVLNSANDLSAYPDRFNQFQINVPTLMPSAPEGDYRYSVYEQASSSNTDVSLTGALLEVGQMKMDVLPDRTYTKYNQSQSFKVYNGAS